MDNTMNFIENFKKEKEKASKYPKFNLQNGDKTEQDFFVKLLRRYVSVTEECDGLFYLWWIHYHCGPEGIETLICLNRTREEVKTNARKCPACAATRKILRNQDDYNEAQIKQAKDQSARERVNWPVYDLNKRKGVEMLEVSSSAVIEILDEFKDDDGERVDLTDHKKHCCLKIKRRGSGLNSRYSYRAAISNKWALTPEDVPIIKATYKTPESVIKRFDLETFNQIFFGDAGIDKESLDHSGEVERVASVVVADSNDLSGLDGIESPTPPAQPSRERTVQKDAPPARERTVEKNNPLSGDDLYEQLEAITQQ